MPDVAPQAGDPGVDQRRVMPQIDTIIVLMLENRSLDSMLGWLHADGAPVRVVPEGSEPPAFDGIPHGVENVAFGAAHAPARGREALGEQRWRVPRQDPREALADVFRQMYGDGDGITSPLTWADEAPMTGFASDFERMLPPDVGEIMGAETVKTHLSHICTKLGISKRAQLAVLAAEHSMRAGEDGPGHA